MLERSKRRCEEKGQSQGETLMQAYMVLACVLVPTPVLVPITEPNNSPLYIIHIELTFPR